MTQTKPKLQTFADFLAYHDDTDSYYELTYGELIEVPPESYDNLRRALKLYDAFKRLVPEVQVCPQGLALAMPGQPKNRYPDLTVLRPEHPEQMRQLGQAAIPLSLAPPLLVVEVVSPGPENYRRDYVDKRNQYEWRGIPEYWIVDPQLRRVIVLAMEHGVYQETCFEETDQVVSPTFPNWAMTVEEMLAG